jgi:hypothetical protein
VNFAFKMLPNHVALDPYVPTPSDRFLGVDLTLGSLQYVLLPEASNFRAGTGVIVKDTRGLAAPGGTSAIVILGSSNIDAEAHLLIDTAYASVNLISNGVDKWHVY